MTHGFQGQHEPAREPQGLKFASCCADAGLLPNALAVALWKVSLLSHCASAGAAVAKLNERDACQRVWFVSAPPQLLINVSVKLEGGAYSLRPLRNPVEIEARMSIRISLFAKDNHCPSLMLLRHDDHQGQTQQR